MEGLRVPPKLYDLCMNVVLEGCRCPSKCLFCQKEFRQLPNTALLDFYERLYQERRLCILANEFGNLDIFNRLLNVRGKIHFLVTCYQSLVDHDGRLTKKLFDTFEKYYNSGKCEYDLIELGLQMGSFLNDGGWYEYSIKYLIVTEKLILSDKSQRDVVLSSLLECYRLKLHAESMYCQFSSATETYEKCGKIVNEIEKWSNDSGFRPSLAGIYCCYSTYHFVRSNFNESYIWAIKALELLHTCSSKRKIIDILRQASKVCVVKKNFMQAGLLIQQATQLGEIMRDKGQLPTFSDILMDYGFYLLNSDCVGESVLVYEEALADRWQIFEKNNILVALAHEDLAYSLYVNEYSSGHFWEAQKHAVDATEIMEKILPADHLLFASVKRVKALILEEIALDERFDKELKEDLLHKAETLHTTALRLSQQYFGEKSIQTAKHYGNLGRLYQTMKKYTESEEMHLKSISIKTELLGPNDYEVALSIGHLASLYNYHMKKHLEAEELYLRSMEINIRLFGTSYSGLEYDYKGLIRIYNKLGEPENALFYKRKYREWLNRDEPPAIEHEKQLLSPSTLVSLFFKIGEDQTRLEEQRAQLAKEYKPVKNRTKSAPLNKELVKLNNSD